MVHFDTVSINDGSSFNSATFTPSEDGFYWFHLAIGAVQNQPVHAELVTKANRRQVFSNLSLLHYYSVSIDDFQHLSSGQTVSVAARSVLSSFLDQTAFLGFRLDNLFSPFFAFKMQNVPGSKANSLFDNFPVTPNQKWSIDGENVVLRMPKAGVYVVSLSVRFTADLAETIATNFICNASLAVNDKTVPDFGVAFFRSGRLQEATLISGLYLLSLRADDALHVFSVKPSGSSQISFQGFMIQPALGRNIAWALKTVDQVDTTQLTTMTFNYVDVNVGNAWKAENNTIVIPTSGLYYLSLTAIVDVGLHNYFSVNVNRAQLVLTTASRQGIDQTGVCHTTLQASTIVSLRSVDQIQVFAKANVIQTYFAGFLLYSY